SNRSNSSTGMYSRTSSNSVSARRLPSTSSPCNRLSNKSAISLLIFLAEQKRNLHGDRVRRTVDFACEAVPALVIFHVGFAPYGVGRQAIDRTGINADMTPADTLLFVYDHRHIE